jgi:23S rRNA pseudouridine2605 synthase
LQERESGQTGEAERLQKVLAHAGVGSRRACEEMILQGRVTVDGQVVRELGTKVDPRSAKILLDGQKIQLERHVYFAVHKPKGYVSTNHDPAGKPRVVDLLPEIPQRVYCVGRLDEQSTGLLLLTNDGELANKLSHPKFGVEKVYRVVVAGTPEREVLQKLTDGMWLAEGKVRAKRVRIVGSRGQASVMEMVLAEGKNREIRRMLAKLGHKVMSLTRIAVGPVGLKGLGVGEFRPLAAREIDLLRKVAAGQFVPIPRAPDRRDRIPRAPRKAAGTGPDPAPPQNDRRPSRSEGPLRPGRGPAPGRPRPRPEGGRSGGGPAHPSGMPRGPLGPPPSARPKADRPGPPPPPRPEGPTRRIIGMDTGPSRAAAGPGPGPRPGRPPGPPRRRPVPKKFPRASLGLKRKPKPGEGAE